MESVKLAPVRLPSRGPDTTDLHESAAITVTDFMLQVQ